jgi:hypothetical protein
MSMTESVDTNRVRRNLKFNDRASSAFQNVLPAAHTTREFAGRMTAAMGDSLSGLSKARQPT